MKEELAPLKTEAPITECYVSCDEKEATHVVSSVHGDEYVKKITLPASAVKDN